MLFLQSSLTACGSSWLRCRLSRTVRLLVVFSGLVAGLWSCAVVYGFRFGSDPTAPLPPLGWTDTLVVSLLGAVSDVDTMPVPDTTR